MFTNKALQRVLFLTLIAAFLVAQGCALLRPRAQDPTFDTLKLTVRAVAHEGEGDENQWLTVCGILNRYGAVDCPNFERTNCQQVGSIRVCDFENITLTFAPPLSLRRLLRLHADLLALRNQGVSLGLTSGNFIGTYSNLASQGTLSIRIRISVTPGATLYLERRFAGVCEEVATENNIYYGEISLRPGQEWIYYRTELGGPGNPIKRYFRLNVSSRQEQELSADAFSRYLGRQ